jgi:phage repressor protein C with HTH and peptisase S24 domain
MRKAISNDKLQVILEQYPDLNPEWLLTGSGNMLRNETSILVEHEYTVKNLDNNIPVYNINFSAGNINVFNDVNADLIGYLNIPELKGSERVIIATGDSMIGVINSGDYIGIKKINDFTYFNYGFPYAIVTEDYRLLKFIRKSENPENIILRSNNPDYDDIELPKNKITGLYLITACLPFSKIKMFM